MQLVQVDDAAHCLLANLFHMAYAIIHESSKQRFCFVLDLIGAPWTADESKLPILGNLINPGGLLRVRSPTLPHN